MPRAHRIQYPGAWYHVMNRGAARRPIYLDPVDRFRFLDLVDEGVGRFGVEIHAYCLMGNHFHLLARTPEPNLDLFMQWFFSRYVRSFNSRHSLDGPLCRGRYKAIVVESEEYAVTLARTSTATRSRSGSPILRTHSDGQAIRHTFNQSFDRNG